MASTKRALERRTGWMFGRYVASRKQLTDPVVSVGFVTESSEGLEYRSGLSLTIGSRGFYLARADSVERGKQRGIRSLERHANGKAS